MTDLQELTMSYEGLVEAGRAAREQADNVQWVEGDLALQVEHLPSTERPRDPETGAFLADDDKVLMRYADDIDIPYRTLLKYRQTAEAWPAALRSAAGWSSHEQLRAQPDRFDLIRPDMTAREARVIVRKRNAASRGKPGWFELLGEVGDALKKARKQLDRAEHAIDRMPSDPLRAKADQYAEWAEELAARLRRVGTAA